MDTPIVWLFGVTVVVLIVFGFLSKMSKKDLNNMKNRPDNSCTYDWDYGDHDD